MNVGRIETGDPLHLFVVERNDQAQRLAARHQHLPSTSILGPITSMQIRYK